MLNPGLPRITSNPTTEETLQAILTKIGDQLSDYKISNIDTSTPAYYGFTDKDGNWYIMKNDSGAYTYVKGASGYTTAWTNRATQTYDYFYNIF